MAIKKSDIKVGAKILFDSSWHYLDDFNRDQTVKPSNNLGTVINIDGNNVKVLLNNNYKITMHLDMIDNEKYSDYSDLLILFNEEDNLAKYYKYLNSPTEEINYKSRLQLIVDNDI